MGPRITTESFITRSKEIHLNKYDYSLAKFTRSKDKVEIICPIHGVFKQNANNHLRNMGCAKCSKINSKEKRSLSRRSTTEEFIIKANAKFKNLYDYSLTNYKGCDTKVKITCKVHGVFEQKPSYHLNKDSLGCPTCIDRPKKGRTRRSNTKGFIERASKLHNNYYNYSLVNYTYATESVKIICPIHGCFEQKAADHLTKRGCLQCSITKRSLAKTLTTKEFIERSFLKHNDKYDYSKSIYINRKTTVKIICKKHGEFLQLPGNHIQGAGCSKCNLVFNSYTRSSWIKRAKDRKGIFYVIKCWNENENFFKLGITFVSIKRRYAGEHMPYNYEIIKTVESTDLGYIWDLEKRFKRFKKKQHYKPLINFGGSKYECFKN